MTKPVVVRSARRTKDITVIAISDGVAALTMWADNPEGAEVLWAALENLNRGTGFTASMVHEPVPLSANKTVITEVVRAKAAEFLANPEPIKATGAPSVQSLADFPDLTGIPRETLERVHMATYRDIYRETCDAHEIDPILARKWGIL